VRALLSVWDKTGLEAFAKGLVALKFELVSSGNTSAFLAEHDIPHTQVAEVTGSPEMLGGRVKTLHPKIHGGILADRSKPEHLADLEANGIAPFDLVACNLYPFRDQPGIEMIDVGGPTMVRAAAKNHASVAVLVDPADYGAVLDEPADVREVPARRPHQRRAADLDHLDARLLAERVEVADDEVDLLDVVGGQIGVVLGLRAVGQDAAGDLRVQRLHAPAEDLGRAGDGRDLEVRDVVLGQEARRPPARHQLVLQRHQALGEGLETGLVPHREQCPHVFVPSIVDRKSLMAAGYRVRSTALIRSCSVSSVSPGRTRTGSWARIGPTSISSVTTCTVQPVTLTP
jgi:hypothetical protein